MAGDSKEERILDAAGKLFREKGYKATSVADIAAKAGFRNKGSIYHYFESKEGIVIEVAQRVMAPLTERLRQIRDSDLPWPEKIGKCISTQLDARNISFYSTGFVVLSELYVKARRQENKKLFLPFKEHDRVWLEIIQQGVDQDYIRRDVNAKLLYFALVGAWNWVYRWYSPKGPLTLKEIREGLTKLFLEGCISKNRAGRRTNKEAQEV